MINISLHLDSYESVLNDIPDIKLILENTNQSISLKSLSQLYDYLEAYQHCQSRQLMSSPNDVSLATKRLQKISLQRDYKQIISAFIDTSVNKLAVLSYQEKNDQSKFNFIWLEYDK